MSLYDQLFVLVVVVFSAVIHEVMHGVAADSLGDPTARYAGRLTLNPIPHLDLFGSIILPLVLALSGSPVFFAWAKPVPYNPYNLRADGIFRRFSEAIVAFAGPLSNAALALIFGLVLRVGIVPAELSGPVFLVVVVNVMLALFNLIPVPPLDGSKVLEAILPHALVHGYARWRRQMEMQPLISMGLVFAIILGLGSYFGALVYSIASAIAGM